MNTTVCIFAHPDDEAFGPGGTIALLAGKQDVYLICVTNGDAGDCSIEKARELSEIRHDELLTSAKILGVKKVFFLDYKDGCLSNSMYHDIASKIEQVLHDLKPDTLLTFEPRGISGHIDHIAVSMITTFLFKKLSFVKKLMYFCISDKHRTLEGDDYFIYFPPGYNRNEVDEVVDITSVWEQKVTGMKTHNSQKHDGERILEVLEQLPKEEYFLVEEKVENASVV